MGASWSGSLNDLDSNPYIQRLIGQVSIDLHDGFWLEFLTFHWISPSSSCAEKNVEESIRSINIVFARNNLSTGNFGTMIRFLLNHIQEWIKVDRYVDNHSALITYNCLLIIRFVCKYQFEVLREETIVRQFLSSPRNPQIRFIHETKEDSVNKKKVSECDDERKKETNVAKLTDTIISVNSEIRDQNLNDDEKDLQSNNDIRLIPEEKLLRVFIRELMNIIITFPIIKNTYYIHYEAINIILSLLSAEIYNPKTSCNSPFHKVIMAQKSVAQNVVRSLLDNFTQQVPPPKKISLYLNTGLFYNIGSAVASGLWSMVSKTNAIPEDNRKSPLGVQSLLLLLALSSHHIQDEGKFNPFRHSLFRLGAKESDVNVEIESAHSDDTPSSSPHDSSFNMSQLYNTICKELHADETTLLLYLLLHRNPSFASYVLSRVDIDSLVIPILKLLYEAEEKNSHHIYMALIILLILSQDSGFNNSIHILDLRSVAWFTERSLNDITLGGLLVLIVIRTIQFNMAKMRDKYLHTNCLAALANMSAHFRALHPYVAQRLLSLYGILSKKHAKVSEKMRQYASQQKNDNKSHEESESILEEYQESSDYAADLAILEEVIRMVLEIINSCLTHSLKYNPHLIYAMLHQKELFIQFRTHPIFQDIIQNIETVLTYFNTRLEETGESNLSVETVFRVINEGAQLWPGDRLKKFPDLRFKYVEEDRPEEFFIPYVWSLVYNSSNLYFNSERIKLF
ncbi:Dymeclin [Trichoplax sp. H2]|nr:Dymeclin [Trichoplax sp. H2]|eukprot:RDD47080.1 Dymeclin [Trichoplax sp. H2]